MKIMKAIKEINWRADEMQTQIDHRKTLKLTDMRVMELVGKRDGLRLAIELININR